MREGIVVTARLTVIAGNVHQYYKFWRDGPQRDAVQVSIALSDNLAKLLGDAPLLTIAISPAPESEESVVQEPYKTRNIGEV